MMAYNSISRWSGALGVCAIVAIIRPAHADPRAVVELFTSQGCSSCPPADKIIGELAKDPSVIALSMPIDYWDYLGWKDTLADARFSARQKAYSQMRGDRDVYTPQVVVNGSVHVIGSDRAGIEGAIGDTKKADGVMSVPVSMTLAGKQINVSVAASSKGAAAMHGEVWICSISKAVPISIGRGENRGREVTYHNVVRNLLKVGDWNGSCRQLDRAAGKYLPRGRRCRGGLCPGRQPRQARRRCWARRTRRCTEFVTLFPGHALRSSRRRDVADARRIPVARCDRAGEQRASERQSPKRKRTNFRWPSMGINYPANRPDPDDPGGLGAEESGTERTGPTQ